MNFKNVNLLGLNSYASHRVTEKNYLLDCNNIVADQLGVIGTRRGQEFLGSAFTLIKKIFTGINELFVQGDDSLYYDNTGTFQDVGLEGTYSPYTDSLIQADSQNESLYFNGIRTSTETSNPVDYKIKKIYQPGAGVVNAGLEAPINLTLDVDTGGNLFQPNDAIRVRVFYQYLDLNNYLITSAVSDSVVGVNDTANPCGFTLKFQIPVQYNSLKVDVYYAISNTFNNITPDDNLFWGEQTLVYKRANINVGLNSVFTFNNITPREQISNPVDLYTNASQEGILQNNDPPMAAYDIDTYSGYTFYSNLKDRFLINGQINVFPLNVEVVTIDGITYKRSSTSNYAATPVEFSGATTLEYAYDFARAVTATQTKVRARVVDRDYSDMGDIVGWVDLVTYPVDLSFPGACTNDNNNNIYVLENTSSPKSKRFFRYNTISNFWTRLPDLPAEVEGANLQFISKLSGEFVYCLMGIDNSNNQSPVYRYNIRTEVWDTLDLPPAVSGVNAIYYAASATNGSAIYIMMGGNFGGTDLPVVYRYQTSVEDWDPAGTVPDVPTPLGAGRFSPMAVYYERTPAPVERKIFLFGGLNTTAQVNSYVYNLATNSWSSISNLPTAKYSAGCCVIGELIYIVDGFTNPLVTETKTIQVYNISTGFYSTLTDTNQTSGRTSALAIDATIYKVGDDSVSGLESYRVGGVNVIIEDRFIGNDPPAWSPFTYFSRVPFDGTSSISFQYDRQATMMFSKQGQPEAVPFFNSFNVGSASSPIVRIAALRSSLIILKTDGLYQLNGISPETFGLQQLDPTCQIIAAQSLAKLDNEIYCLTSKGVACINESGARIISYPIKDLIDSQLYSVPEANWNTAITATAYDLDYKYVITIGNKTFTYNYITEQWTIWHAGNANIKSWTVFENKIYYADTTRVLKERKSFTSADFQDENGNGIDASMQFNNLEFSPGKQLLVQDMQILQRNISNLTVGIQFENDFNTPASFDKSLDAYVSRVFPPNGSRQAFYFRPKFTWNTEIVATPGTFATSSFEGLDIGYEELKSNLR